MSNKLNPQQLAFCLNIAEGLTQSEAYRKAYPDSSQQASNANSARLIIVDSVKSEITRLRDITHTDRKLSRMEKREILAEIAVDPQASNADRIRAISTDNSMAGHNMPDMSGEVGKLMTPLGVSIEDLQAETQRLLQAYKPLVGVAEEGVVEV